MAHYRKAFSRFAVNTKLVSSSRLHSVRYQAVAGPLARSIAQWAVASDFIIRRVPLRSKAIKSHPEARIITYRSSNIKHRLPQDQPYKNICKARGAGDSVKPGVERSATPEPTIQKHLQSPRSGRQRLGVHTC